jgi:hypothetical protein
MLVHCVLPTLFLSPIINFICIQFYAGFYPRDLFSWSKRKEGCKLSLATGGHDMKVNMRIHTNDSTHSNGYCTSCGVLHASLTICSF